MKKTLSMILCILLTGLLIGCGVQTTEPAEETGSAPQTAALEAYRDILKAAPAIEGEHDELMDASFNREQNHERFGDHYDMFAVIDINQDGVPELIAQSVINFRWTSLAVYTYTDGAAILLQDSQSSPEKGSIDQMSTANGAYTTYICEAQHIHSVWSGADPFGEELEENSAWAIDGTTLTAAECAEGENEKIVYFYDIAQVNNTENADALVQ